MFEVPFSFQIPQVTFVCWLVVRDDENQEPDHAENGQEKDQQKPSNEEVGGPLLFRPGVGDAEGRDEGLGQPGE